MSIRVATVLLTVFAFGLFAPSATAVSGELRTLYVLITWGPIPFSQAELQRVAAETDAFFRESSSGRLSMPGTVGSPVELPREWLVLCDPIPLFDFQPSLVAGYHRAVFVTPIVDDCEPLLGFAPRDTEALLNGRLSRALAAHELGHTLGLRLHANRCSGAGSCTPVEYGNPFTVMGSGDGDLTAYEKWRLGWLNGIRRPGGNGLHELGSIEEPTTLPQALVVTTAASEFWFESRGLPTPSRRDDSVQPPGIAVLAGPNADGYGSPYPYENLLLPNPNGGARYAYTAGESFVEPGVFRVTVEQHARESAALRFEWLDRVAPAAPRLRIRPTRPGRVRLTWKSALERGSGVEAYTVILDGRAVRTIREVPLTNWEATLPISPGRHRLGVYATDRAGNRGRASFARVRVKQRR